MSDKNSKTKQTQVSKTVRKEPEGEIASIFPPQEELADFPNEMDPFFSGNQEPIQIVELEDPQPSYGEAPQAEMPSLTPEPKEEFSQGSLPVQDPSPQQIDRLPAEQADVLRKYIALKEAESRDLKEQQKQYQVHVRKLTAQLQAATGKTQDLVAELETLKRREESARKEARGIEKQAREEIIRLKNEFEEQARRSGNVSSEYQELQKRREEWKEKVREDLKRIKLKERELENKYELLKRDTQALLDSKDKHVMELKRKNDALELEMEGLEERLRYATLGVSNVQAKKRRLIETLRLAIALLEQVDTVETPEDEQKKTG